MSGYGSPDDEQERATLNVEERIALARLHLPSGPGTMHCVECGDDIPEARRKVLPGVRHCVDCQATKVDTRQIKFKQPWAT